MTKLKPIAGVSCLCADTDGKIIGKPYKSSRTNLRDRYYIEGIGGEHWGCVLTEVARRYPYPEVEGFIPEGYIWLQIAKDYDDLSINEPLRIYHAHEPDALSQKRLTLTAGNVLYAIRMIRHDWMYASASPIRFIKAAVIAIVGPPMLRITKFRRWLAYKFKDLAYWLGGSVLTKAELDEMARQALEKRGKRE